MVILRNDYYFPTSEHKSSMEAIKELIIQTIKFYGGDPIMGNFTRVEPSTNESWFCCLSPTLLIYNHTSSGSANVQVAIQMGDGGWITRGTRSF